MSFIKGRYDKMKKVTLVLQDGTKFHGKSFGYDKPVLVVAESCAEFIRKLSLDIIAYFVSALGSEFAEPFADNGVIFACHEIKKSLQIAGNKDIHRRRYGCVELSVSVVNAGIYKIGKNVVYI